MSRTRSTPIDTSAQAAGAAAAASVGRPPGRLPPSAARQVARHYETLTRWEDLERWLDALRGAELFAFDTETTSLDYMRAEIVGLSFCIEPGTAAYVPLAHDYRGRAARSSIARRVLEALKPMLEDPTHGQTRPSSQVRRPRAAESWYPPGRHAL